VVSALVGNPDAHKKELAPLIRDFCVNLDGRSSTWQRLAADDRPELLVGLLWAWLLHLKRPALSKDQLGFITSHWKSPEKGFASLDQVARDSFFADLLVRSFLQSIGKPEKKRTSDSIQFIGLHLLCHTSQFSSEQKNSFFD